MNLTTISSYSLPQPRINFVISKKPDTVLLVLLHVQWKGATTSTTI